MIANRLKQIFKSLLTKWLLLIILMVITFFISLFMGRYVISPKTVMEILFNTGNSNGILPMESSIVLGIRLPRTILSMLIGASLSVAGVAYQGIFKNPLVSPDVLGVSSGAGFGAVLGILFLE